MHPMILHPCLQRVLKTQQLELILKHLDNLSSHVKLNLNKCKFDLRPPHAASMGDMQSKEPAGPTGRGCSDIPHFKAGKTITCKAKKMIVGEERNEVTLKLEQVAEIGRGAFGVVNKMVCKSDDNNKSELVAVKIPGGEGVLAKIELSLLARLSHHNVVELLYFFPGMSNPKL